MLGGVEDYTFSQPGILLLTSMSKGTDGDKRPGEFVGPLPPRAFREYQVEDQTGSGKGRGLNIA